MKSFILRPKEEASFELLKQFSKETNRSMNAVLVEACENYVQHMGIKPAVEKDFSKLISYIDTQSKLFEESSIIQDLAILNSQVNRIILEAVNAKIKDDNFVLSEEKITELRLLMKRKRKMLDRINASNSLSTSYIKGLMQHKTAK